MREAIRRAFLLIGVGTVLFVRGADAGPVYSIETRTIATNNVFDTSWSVPSCGTCQPQVNGTLRWDVYVTDFYHLTFSVPSISYGTLDPGPGNWGLGPPQATQTTTAIPEGGTATTHYFVYAVAAPGQNPNLWNFVGPIVKSQQTVALEQTTRWYLIDDEPIPPPDPLAFPEPGTLILLGSSLVVLAIGRWRRKGFR